MRTALHKILRLPPGDLTQMVLWRDRGREPACFEAKAIRQMLPLVEEAA